MNPSATAAAPRAAHEALDASPRVPTSYLPNTEYLRDLGLPTSAPPTTSFLLPTSFSGGGRRQHFSFKTAVRRRPLPNGALHARSARGGTLVVHVAMPATCLQIGEYGQYISLILGHSLVSRGHSLVVKFMEFSTVFSIFNAWRRQILPPVP